MEERLKRKISKQKEKILLLEELIESRSREIFNQNTQLQSVISELQKNKNMLDEVVLVSETDLAGNIIYANDKFCKISQYSLDELVGSKHRVFKSGFHPAEFWSDFWQHLKNNRVWRGDICNKAKDGSLTWGHTTASPIVNTDGEVTGYSSVSIDITEKKLAESKMMHSAKLASIGEMAAGVGHEINNPLAISVGNTNLLAKILKKEGVEIPKIFERIAKINLANDRIRKIVDGLRTYARSDSDERELISVNIAIIQTLNLLAEIYEGEGVTIEVGVPDEEVYIIGNIGKLQQVLMNFISNAKDATEGQDSRIIKISLHRASDTQAIFSVQDNGHGISDDILDKILNPFFTTKEIGKGTGMGLGVVNELLKSIEGILDIQTKVGEGSTFSVTMPLATPDDVRPGCDTHLGITAEKTLNIQGSALIVDDELEIRLILRGVLEELGLSVEEADDGEIGLEKVKQKHFDYVFTDMKMKRMQGHDFIVKAANLENIQAKFVIVTGGVSSDYTTKRSSAFKGIVKGYLAKPFTKESVEGLFQNILLKT